MNIKAGCEGGKASAGKCNIIGNTIYLIVKNQAQVIIPRDSPGVKNSTFSNRSLLNRRSYVRFRSRAAITTPSMPPAIAPNQGLEVTPQAEPEHLPI
ncbi:MAG: hypothetical protein PHY25_00945 [Dehalococcoidales bacterium]|nr:hypothetical protein [Dehalococcoidales bacterium]MDD4465242.1 hypothetical protein [Dehalococcoidales bacterium]MDD5401649.1 hypothetical protein [Dehalococcoidales bacterium]NLE90778.1 hypothetical protein [Dehalococcoidales bacterium]